MLRPTARSAVRFASTSFSRNANRASNRSLFFAASAAVGLAAAAAFPTLNADEASDLVSALPDNVKAHVESTRQHLKTNAQLAASAPQQVLWNAIRKDIEAIIEDEASSNPGKDGFPGNSGGGGDVGPMLVRLAWHCGGSYDKESGTGGTNGATMRFSPEADHGGNAGLGHARALLEPIKAKYGKFGVTYADIYVFAGCVAIEAMGGPSLPFRAGRSDATKVASPEEDKRFSPDGRLPDADGRNTDPANHLRDIFYRMGFDDRQIVALSGAHCLGRCHTDRSGFWGPWTNAPTTFSNQYFVMLEEQDWYVKRTHKGAEWTGPLQYEDTTGELMMLPTDLALIHDRGFRPVVAEYYKNEEQFFQDFVVAWTTLTENGCEGILSDTVIVNLEGEAVNVADTVKEKVGEEVEKFQAALGGIATKAKKKGWFW